MNLGEDVLSKLPPDERARLGRLPADEREMQLRSYREMWADKRLRKLFAKMPQGQLAASLTQRLLAGCANRLFRFRLKPEIDPALVCQFLADLAYCRHDRLSWAVRLGLKSLGIKRIGHPLGRKKEMSQSDLEIAVKVKITRERMARAWKKRCELRGLSSADWRRRLKGLWHSMMPKYAFPDAILYAKSLKSLSMHIVAAEKGVSFDAIYAACKRARKASKTRSGILDVKKPTKMPA